MNQAEEVQPTLNIPPVLGSSGPVKASATQPIIYSSSELLQGRREVWIEHGDQMYRLRVTSANKLYLTK